MNGFRCIIEFKDISVADECLVVHEVMVRHSEGLGCEVILVGRVGGESEMAVNSPDLNPIIESGLVINSI